MGVSLWPHLYPGLGVRFGVGEEATRWGFLLPSILLLSCFSVSVCLRPGPPLSPPQKLGSPCTWLRRPGARPPPPRVLSTAPLTQPGRSCRPSMGASPQTPPGTRAPGASMRLQNGARGTAVGLPGLSPHTPRDQAQHLLLTGLTSAPFPALLRAQGRQSEASGETCADALPQLARSPAPTASFL